MTEDLLVERLQQMLAESHKNQRVFAAELAHFRRLARKQNRQLTIGRLRIDASRAALEARASKFSVEGKSQ